MKVTRTKPSTCPHCQKFLSAASSLTDHEPRPGDATVCIHCIKFCIFQDDLSVRLPTSEEATELAASEDAQAAIMLLRGLHRARREGESLTKMLHHVEGSA